MPRSGDGDLWPTTDDDSSTGNQGDVARRLATPPDQREQRWPTEQPAERPQQAHPWFDQPTALSRPQPPRDQTHAEQRQQPWFDAPPQEQQRTRPVSLPTEPDRQPQDEATRRIQTPQQPPQQAPQQSQRQPPEWPPPEPPRAAPMRVGPQPPDEESEPAAPRKRRRPLLITLVALVAVLGIAAGVVFGVPGLSDRLGLTDDGPGFTAAPPPAPVEFAPGLRGPDEQAPAPSRQGVESALAGPTSDPALGTLTGVVIDPANGQVLWERDAGTQIVPASTGKLLTAAAALLSLDHTEQLVTKVVQGTEPGDVVIVGGGDVTLSSLPPGEVSMYPGAAHLGDLVDQVKRSGVQVQTVHIDVGRYTGPELAPSWLPVDIGAGYITPMTPVMLDGGRSDPKVNYSPRTNNPAGVVVDEFAARLGATAPDSAIAEAPDNGRVLGEVRSAPVSQLVDNMLDHSDNMLAEAIAHEVAIKEGQEASFAGASKAMLDVLKRNGFDVNGVTMVDASGMSMEDKVPAKLLGEILATAAAPNGEDPRTAKLRPLLGGLPVAGGSGTLGNRYDEGPAMQGRGWVRAKTGSLTGVNSLAGIVVDADNRPLVFAFLTAETTATTARPALDLVAATLRGCGCG